VLLNVNVPDIPYEDITGIEVTRLGRRHKAQPVVQGKNPRGETVYWVGPAGAAREAGPGTDFHALERGAVSVTPLQVDLTHANQIPLVSGWIQK
jgi:5'-nucleotidase